MGSTLQAQPWKSRVVLRPSVAVPGWQAQRSTFVRLPRLGIGAYGFWLSVTVYLVTAVILVFEMHLVVGDALSRVGNAYYVFFSRDPHLAAIGFVWNPLPSVLVMPLLPFRFLWPELVTEGFAANIVSSIAMAATVWQLWKLFGDWRLGSPLAIGLTALFALHPMTVQYGANGNSEALFLLVLVGLCRTITAWLASRSTGSLVATGLLLAVAYLTRYEAIAVAMAVVCIVAASTFLRGRDRWVQRLERSWADAVVVGAPPAMAFALWAAVSWLIVGNPFEQFSSIYGTSSQMQASGLEIWTGAGMSRLELVVAQVLGLSPGALLVGVLAIVAAAVSRDARVVVPLSTFGAVLAFAVLAWLTGRTGGWIRYYIAVIPLTIVVAGLLASQVAKRMQAYRPHTGLPRAAAIGASAMVGTLVVGASAMSLVSSLDTMRDPVLGREDHYKGLERPRYQMARAVADYLDARDLDDGSVLIDAFLGFPIILASDFPRQFVITADRDFEAVVADPIIHGVEYVLVPPSGAFGSLDAIARQWPGIYEDGSSIGSLEREFIVPNGESVRWRLYRLDRPPTPLPNG